jgi:ABC-type cobalamin/Fe3+-siderophores transport system ATPase subunit
MSSLSFDQVCFSYGKAPCVVQFSCNLAKGELVGLIGANGSGKSTLLRLGAGLLKPTVGQVELDGQPVRSWRGEERAARLGYLPQSIEAPLPFRVGELVEMGRAAARRDHLLSCRELLATVGLDGFEQTPLAQISGGERRRAFIAMILAQGGKTLLLDEPLAGLDLRYQYELLALLRNLCQSRNLTILLSLHDLILARNLDRLLVIRQGQLLADGLPSAILTQQLVQQTFDLDPGFQVPEIAW